MGELCTKSNVSYEIGPLARITLIKLVCIVVSHMVVGQNFVSHIVIREMFECTFLSSTTTN